MGRSPGSKKTGGRIRGTPNARTLNLAQRLEHAGLDPVQIIFDNLPTLEAEQATRVALGLLPFLFPKRKPAIEPTLVDVEAFLQTASKAELGRIRSYLDELTQAGASIEERKLNTEQYLSTLAKRFETNTWEIHGLAGRIELGQGLTIRLAELGPDLDDEDSNSILEPN